MIESGRNRPVSNHFWMEACSIRELAKVPRVRFVSPSDGRIADGGVGLLGFTHLVRNSEGSRRT